MKTLTKKSLIIRELIITIVTLAAYFIVFSACGGWNSQEKEFFDAVNSAAFVVGLATLIVTFVVDFATPATSATSTAFVAALAVAASAAFVVSAVFTTAFAAFFIIAAIFAFFAVYNFVDNIDSEPNLSTRFVILSFIAEFLLITAGMLSVYLFK